MGPRSKQKKLDGGDAPECNVEWRQRPTCLSPDCWDRVEPTVAACRCEKLVAKERSETTHSDTSTCKSGSSSSYLEWHLAELLQSQNLSLYRVVGYFTTKVRPWDPHMLNEAKL